MLTKGVKGSGSGVQRRKIAWECGADFENRARAGEARDHSRRSPPLKAWRSPMSFGGEGRRDHTAANR